MQQNTRNHFSIPTNTDFFTIEGLQSSTGQAVYHFGNVVFKELIDNALDACESAGIEPQITIGFKSLDNDKTMRLMVSDNAAGLDGAVIEKILDFSTRTSDKAAYKSPTRGAQGNALKTILGIPTALGGGLVAIESHNQRHEITFDVTPTMAIIPRHDITDTPRATIGTTITVTMPLLETWHKPNARYWVQAFALFNPHSFVSFENEISTPIFNNSPAITYKRLADCTKITPNKPTNANSYTPADFYTLAYTTAEQANKPIGEFIRQFDGLKSTTKAKAITNVLTGGARFVSDIHNDRATVTALHDAMKAQSKPIQHKQLGAIGAAHLLARLNDVTRHEYRQITGYIDGVPYVFEVLIAECSDTGGAFYGVNHSPTYKDFLSGAYLVTGKKTGYGIDGLLRGIIDKEKYTVVCHFIGIGLKFTDKGKTNLELSADIANIIAGAIIQTANAIKRATVATDSTSKQPTFKAAIFQVLPAAIALATNNGAIPANVRNVFYKTRELIQPLKTGELLYDTFTDVLTQFWAANGRNKNVYNDARGLMYEPHSGAFLPLGSMEVDGYEFPPFQFDKILFIEKKGLWHTVKSAGLHQKYDMAVIASEGFATVAIRDLLERAQTCENMTIFALHDADAAGYEIARTLQEATRTMPNHNITVIDLGLFIQDALDIGIEPETLYRTQKLSQKLNLNKIEREFFEGVPATNGKNKACFECKRIELNALSAGQLVEYIDNGIKRAIAENGLTNKVIPPETVLSETMQTLRREKLKALAMNALIEKYAINEKVNQFVDSMTFDNLQFSSGVNEYLMIHECKTWRDGLNTLAENDLIMQRGAIDSRLNTI